MVEPCAQQAEMPLARTSRDDFNARLDQLAAHANGNRTLALLVIRIHNLHRVNATFGYVVNRRIVEYVGLRLGDALHEHDEIYLIADDEYALILPDLANRGHAELAANRMLRSIDEPVRVGATLHDVKITVGVAACSGASGEAAQLLQRAELALAHAEDKSRGLASYADANALATAAEWDVESELTDAIENGELEMHYQPQIDLESGRIDGAEALMRWRHPRRGFLQPAAFIGAAERGNQIRGLTWSALNMALSNAALWPRLEPPVSISVNVSARLLSDPEFVAMVLDAVAIWGLKTTRLTLEITETAFMHEYEAGIATLKALHAQGIDVSIDDFGTGYSSFAYFRDLPASELKIDKSFVVHLLEHGRDADIVDAIITLAHKFGLRVVAEGVTDQATFDALRYLGCDSAQGYWLAEPMPQDEFIAFLNDHRGDK
jgi:diguanylate cyclase (GGDEF)-like protein